VSVAHFFNSINCEESCRVHRALIKFCPLECRHSDSVLSCQDALHTCSVTTVAQRRGTPEFYSHSLVGEDCSARVSRMGA